MEELKIINVKSDNDWENYGDCEPDYDCQPYFVSDPYTRLREYLICKGDVKDYGTT